MNKMPAGLENMKRDIWSNLKGKINPRTKKNYTESEALAIATSQWKKSGKNLSVGVDDEFEPEQDMMSQAIKKMEGDSENEN